MRFAFSFRVGVVGCLHSGSKLFLSVPHASRALAPIVSSFAGNPGRPVRQLDAVACATASRRAVWSDKVRMVQVKRATPDHCWAKSIEFSDGELWTSRKLPPQELLEVIEPNNGRATARGLKKRTLPRFSRSVILNLPQRLLAHLGDFMHGQPDFLFVGFNGHYLRRVLRVELCFRSSRQMKNGTNSTGEKRRACMASVISSCFMGGTFRKGDLCRCSLACGLMAENARQGILEALLRRSGKDRR